MAARMRPRTLSEFVGQAAVVGPGTALRSAIERGHLSSLILWGPPGVGKTTLAELIAKTSGSAVERITAVASGVKDLREIIKRALAARSGGQRTALIMDEIHRFNKGQQDVLLPAVEEGVVTLLGVTTANPYFAITAALISRAPVVRLEGLGEEALGAIVDRALGDRERGLGGKLKLKPAARAALVTLAAGDGRRALNILERAAIARAAAREGSARAIDRAEVEAAAQQAAIHYDRAGDVHYDTISAFIKSLRGSDPDAALFYLFRMLVAGEDPRFIVRRMFIFASEDIGNADPHALMLAAAAGQALEWVGLPEAEFALAHAATYLAAAPKSNSITAAMHAAKADVAQYGNVPPPGHVVNAPIVLMRRHGRGVGYQYPHAFPGHIVRQQYRPDPVQDHVYYQPGEEGFEREVKRRVERARAVLYPKNG